MSKPTRFQGRAWVITDDSGRLIPDIDTDMIYHNAHLAITDVEAMGKHAFGNLQGWQDFPSRVRPGDILVVGANFGAGSSRQHAVDCFRALGIQALVAASFGAIYKRNAINSGFPILTWPELEKTPHPPISSGDEVMLDLGDGTLSCEGGTHQLQPFSQVQMDIYQAGNLFAFGKR